jgi:hypothetical protein
MELKRVKGIKYNEYTVKFAPEDEAVLLDIGRQNVLKDNQECITYGIQKLIEWYMNGSKEDITFDDVDKNLLARFNITKE